MKYVMDYVLLAIKVKFSEILGEYFIQDTALIV